MKKIYFATAIIISIILAIIGFLVIKANTLQQTDVFNKATSSLQTDNEKIGKKTTISFEIEHNLPLKNNNIIPKTIVIGEKEIYLPIKKIIFNHQIDLSYFEKLNNSKLNKIVSASVIVKLIVKKQYRQWFTIKQLDKKLLQQVNFPGKFIDWIINLSHNKQISEQEFAHQLKLTLTGSNKKYWDLLKQFTVLDET